MIYQGFAKVAARTCGAGHDHFCVAWRGFYPRQATQKEKRECRVQRLCPRSGVGAPRTLTFAKPWWGDQYPIDTDAVSMLSSG